MNEFGAEFASSSPFPPPPTSTPFPPPSSSSSSNESTLAQIKASRDRVAQIDNPKLQNSNFMQFIDALSDGRLQVQDGNVVETSSGPL